MCSHSMEPAQNVKKDFKSSTWSKNASYPNLMALENFRKFQYIERCWHEGVHLGFYGSKRSRMNTRTQGFPLEHYIVAMINAIAASVSGFTVNAGQCL